MTQSEIESLESALKRYKNNLAFAIRTNSKQRESHNRSLINTTENRLRELGKELPLESNKYLRTEIGKLTDSIAQLRKDNQKLQKELKDQNEKIVKLLNPEAIKKEIEMEKEATGEEMLKCPRCGRSVRAKGMKTHQTRWCKAAK